MTDQQVQHHLAELNYEMLCMRIEWLNNMPSHLRGTRSADPELDIERLLHLAYLLEVQN